MSKNIPASKRLSQKLEAAHPLGMGALEPLTIDFTTVAYGLR